VGVAISVDRQERGEGTTSAVQEVETGLGLKVISIVNLETLLTFLDSKGDSMVHRDAIAAYRKKYGT